MLSRVAIGSLQGVLAICVHWAQAFREWYLRPTSSEQRGIKLLREWLSPEQLAQFDTHHYFEVIGCHTNKRYRISYGVGANVAELDDVALPRKGWCFVPDYQLVVDDVMLAQKIALETDERGAWRRQTTLGLDWLSRLPFVVNKTRPRCASSRAKRQRFTVAFIQWQLSKRIDPEFSATTRFRGQRQDHRLRTLQMNLARPNAINPAFSTRREVGPAAVIMSSHVNPFKSENISKTHWSLKL